MILKQKFNITLLIYFTNDIQIILKILLNDNSSVDFLCAFKDRTLITLKLFSEPF